MLGEGCFSSFLSCSRSGLTSYFVLLKVLLVLLHALVVDLITGSHGLVQLFIRHLSHKSPQPLQFSCQLPSHPKQFISYQSIYKHWINIKKGTHPTCCKALTFSFACLSTTSSSSFARALNDEVSVSKCPWSAV